MATLAGVTDPFRKAEILLGELAGWSIDSESIRRLTHTEANTAAAGRAARKASPAAFADAPAECDYEVHIDAGKVNTPTGWRDVKVAVVLERERADPADPSVAKSIEERELPDPVVRTVVAAVESADQFAERCAAEITRLGITDMKRLTVLGDGAEWIWGLADSQFNGARQTLDVWHAAEKLAEAGRESLDSEAFTPWLANARQRLVCDGYYGVCESINDLSGGATSAAVLNYFCGHQDRLYYAARLRRGQAIGSGAVEGAVKQLVNVRMKRTGARWLAKHVGKFVELLAMRDTPEWAEYWHLQAA